MESASHCAIIVRRSRPSSRACWHSLHTSAKIAAAIGVIAALGRPWYAPAVKGDEDAQMESLFAGIGRAFTEPAGRTGWEAFSQADSLIAGLAVATVVLLALAMVPLVQTHV